MSLYSIVRNGLAKALSEQAFGKKSDHYGKHFQAPVMNVNTFDEDVVWWGKEEISSIVNKATRLVFADIYLDSIDPNTGLLNETTYLASCADFTAGVSRMGDLDEQIEELQALQQSYALDDQFGEVDDAGNKTVRAVELETSIRETAEKIRPLKVLRKSIEAKYAIAAEKRAASKAAKAATASK